MSSTELALFSVAKEALAEAVKVDEVKDVRDHAERIRLYGQQANDRTIIADATEIIMRAERRLGELLRSAHETGQLGIGRPSRSNIDDEGEEAPEEEDTETVEVVRPQRVTLAEAGISKKLSTRSQKFAAVAETAFEAALLSAREKILAGGAVVVNPLKDLSTAEKKSRRRAREIELGTKQMALPEARFGVIYADPEWQFEPYSDETGMDRAADNHYPTSGLDAIKGRDVGSLAADDCVLFLWATVPMLPQALEVMAAWGFEYKSNFDWRKDRVGTGYWNRNRHEHMLIGTRGKVPAPAMGEQFDSSIEAPVGEHSAKPEKFYEIIETYFPTLPKIELNARVARPGWVRWGYEAPEPETATSSPHHLEPIRGDDGAMASSQEGSTGRQPADTLRAGRTGAETVTAGETAPLPLDEADAIILAGDAEKTPLAVLAEMVGRPGNITFVKNSRRRQGLSSRDRQREAVSEANRRRATK
ncbi:MAG TPA: MT-A70 family methyltransferase [Devosia sp.]|nr:MT-A70 family methyltransferase [Devosia sp.]